MKVTGTHSLTLFQGTPKLVAAGSLKADGSFGEDLPKGTIPVTPEEGDFHSFMFRHLSATIVGPNSWKASDFTNEDVLKKAVPLLKNKPAYTNHYVSIGNEIGYVGQPKWTDSYTNATGQIIPAGIDAPFVLDAVLQPKLVRQLNSPVSPVTCCSVTIDFDWEASHEFEREWDFYMHLGEMVEGTMVRRIATNIVDIYESSLVWRGADPYAKRLVDGEVQDVPAVATSASEDSYDADKRAKAQQFIVVSGLSGGRAASFSHASHKPTSKPEPGSTNPMHEFLFKFLATQLGLPLEEVKAFDEAKLNSFKVVKVEAFDTLTREAGEAKTAKESVTSLTTAKDTAENALTTANNQVTSLGKEKETLETEVARLKPLAASGESYTKALRTSAEDAYTKFLKGKPADVTIIAELGSATVEQLEAKVKMWGGEVVASFAPTCTKCDSSEHIAMRSTVAEKTPIGGGEGHDEDEVPLAQMLRS